MVSEISYQKLLERVSRSFAFCIAELRSPFQDWVGLMYLLCRIVDTFEDSEWSDAQSRRVVFDNFLLALKEKNVKFVIPTDKIFNSAIKSEEKELINLSQKLIDDFHGLELDVRLVLYDTISSMAKGMEYQLRLNHKKNSISLNTLVDINKYCFYVAGVVGEALTRLYFLRQNKKIEKQSIIESYHFGLFLQKINILKDVLEDKKQGRNFFPDFFELRTSLSFHLEPCLEYICKIESVNKDYKTFCAWSFFLALASLPYIDKTFQNQSMTKIPRWKTIALINKIKIKVEDNEYLKKLFKEYLELLSLKARDCDNHLELDWDSSWGESYKGILQEKDMMRVVQC
jgi:farnesyl-diphosphate farnesyltransferase